jgi:hypothetical protein
MSDSDKGHKEAKSGEAVYETLNKEILMALEEGDRALRWKKQGQKLNLRSRKEASGPAGRKPGKIGMR